MPDLTTDDLARLRAIAQAALARPFDDKINPSGTVASVELAHHHATFDPPTVLALLDEIERLRRQLKPSKPSGLMAALCADVQRARTSHRNPQLPQEPPSHG